MRCLLCLLSVGLSVFLLVGCRNSSVPLSNPFLSPDRVPPPATRAPLPGTAQPYYPNNGLPNTPPPGQPAPAFTPGAPGATYAPAPTTPTTPPGGWNAYPQPTPGAAPGTSPGSSSRSTVPAYGVRPTSAEVPLGPGNGSLSPRNEQPVQVQGDNESLRFAQAAPQFSTAPAVAPQRPAYPSATSAPVRMPIQAIVPSPFTNVNHAQPPTAGGAELAGYQTPAAQPPLAQRPSQSAAQPVRIRAISQAELQSNNQRTSAAGAAPTRDGFRPQGSRSASRRQQRGSIPRVQGSSGFRGFGPIGEVTRRFAYDPQYQWLRGQLEYAQATNQWKLRYIPIEEQTDRFGGSVLIANPHVLGNLRPDDFVLVRGRLQAQETDARSFAPVYTISVVQRQRQ